MAPLGVSIYDGRVSRPRGLTLAALAGLIGGCAASYRAPDWEQVGRSSGLPPQKLLIHLSPEERTTLCTWGATALGGLDRHYQCPHGVKISTYSKDACLHTQIDVDDCRATVADQERCVVRIASDPCIASWGSLAECRPILNRCIGAH